MGIKDLLELTVQRGASDIHFITGLPPYLRVQGVLTPVNSAPILTQESIDKYLKEIMSPDSLERFPINN